MLRHGRNGSGRSILSRLLRCGPWLSRGRSALGPAGARAAASNAASTVASWRWDTMTRFPDASARGAMRLLDYFGTAVFAASGAATAGEAGLDSFGSTFVGAVTALGGGTTRDLLLGRQAFWLAEGEYVIIAVASGALSFFCWPFWGFSGDSFGLFAADSLSLGTFCTIGAMNGCNAAVSPHIAALCGMATATFGGAARDLLTRKPVRILHNYAEVR